MSAPRSSTVVMRAIGTKAAAARNLLLLAATIVGILGAAAREVLVVHDIGVSIDSLVVVQERLVRAVDSLRGDETKDQLRALCASLPHPAPVCATLDGGT